MHCISQDLSLFMRTVFARAQMEAECIIMSVIYLERLLKQVLCAAVFLSRYRVLKCGG
jgi:hypothetical protein